MWLRPNCELPLVCCLHSQGSCRIIKCLWLRDQQQQPPNVTDVTNDDDPVTLEYLEALKLGDGAGGGDVTAAATAGQGKRKHAANKRVTFVVADDGGEGSGQNESSSAGGKKRKYFP